MNPKNQTPLQEIWGWQGKIRTIADRAKHILGKDILSDVTFRVVPSNGSAVVDIKAHKFLLAMGSEVFETMFYGSLTEDTGVVKILDIDPEPFRLLLRYIYHDQLGPFDKSTAFSTLYAAKKYGIPILKNACEEYLKTSVAPDNCLAWLVQAQTYDEPNLAGFCLEKVDLWGSSVLQSPDFLNISIGVLQQILRRDTLKVKELEVCNACIRWATQRCAQKKIACIGPNLRSELREALFLIRFPIMTSEEVAAGPAKLGLLLSDEVNRLFQFWFANEKLPANFIVRQRTLNTEIKLSRFTGVKYGWTYRNGSPDIIEFSVSSGNKNGHPLCRLPSSDTIRLVAIGLYVQNPLATAKRCTAAMIINADQTNFGYDKRKMTMGIHDYRGMQMPKTDLQEFSNSWTIPGTASQSTISKFKLNKAMPIKEGNWYTMSVQIVGMEQSMYGTGGTESVAASAGNRNVIAHFRGRQGQAQLYNYQTGSSASGATTVAQGQIPELYFEFAD